nr:iron-siderophore ABC transporter substrate-binding protein [Streptomyces sp. DSM 41633]
MHPSTTAAHARTCGKRHPTLRKAGYSPMSSPRLRLLAVAAALVSVAACGGATDAGNKSAGSASGSFPLPV